MQPYVGACLRVKHRERELVVEYNETLVHIQKKRTGKVGRLMSKNIKLDSNNKDKNSLPFLSHVIVESM